MEEENFMAMMMFSAAAFIGELYSEESANRKRERKQKQWWVRDWLRREDAIRFC